jgi:hypothetical protein
VERFPDKALYIVTDDEVYFRMDELARFLTKRGHEKASSGSGLAPPRTTLSLLEGARANDLFVAGMDAPGFFPGSIHGGFYVVSGVAARALAGPATAVIGKMGSKVQRNGIDGADKWVRAMPAALYLASSFDFAKMAGCPSGRFLPPKNINRGQRRRVAGGSHGNGVDPLGCWVQEARNHLHCLARVEAAFQAFAQHVRSGKREDPAAVGPASRTASLAVEFAVRVSGSDMAMSELPVVAGLDECYLGSPSHGAGRIIPENSMEEEAGNDSVRFMFADADGPAAKAVQLTDDKLQRRLASGACVVPFSSKCCLHLGPHNPCFSQRISDYGGMYFLSAICFHIFNMRRSHVHAESA